ncbi:uncharacterized protein LOC117644251 [Thrips palmi]|uniref:Uncharacterized protein LOC117644251 n=1 Tax=Thrips palmi TaxID=161013 RepID=A0A6P8YI03_THRPL|nr:uncharacterized protein LOC117644251 [Thrips palmi]
MSKTALALFAVAAFATLASAQNSKYAAELTKAGENGGRAARGVRPRLGQHQLQGALEPHLGAERTAQRLALRRGQGRLQQGHRRAGTDRRQGADVPHCVQEATGHAVHRPGQQIPEPRKGALKKKSLKSNEKVWMFSHHQMH